MFDIFAIVLASSLWLTAHNRYKNIAFVLLLWLMISHLVYTYLLLEFRAANNWVIYQMYNAINCVVIYALVQLNSHMLPVCMLALNILLNIIVSFYFASDIIPIIVYNSYSYIAGAVVIIILGYMRLLHDGNRLRRRENNNSNTFNLFFFSRPSGSKLLLFGRLP